jgi:membrane associated rhomboid family serine protease
VLALANVVLFILGVSVHGFTPGLHMTAARMPAEPLSLLTFLFASATFVDTALAAVILVYFCQDLEKNLGTGKFLLLFFCCGLAGAGAQVMGVPRLPVTGGTAAAIGALVVYSYLWPLNRVAVFGTISTGPRQLLMITVGYRFLWGFGMTGAGGGTGLSLLGGAAMGALFCGWLSHTSAASKYRRALRTALVGDAASWSTFDWNSVSREGLHSVTLEEFDRIAAKAKEKGMRALTEEERALVRRLWLRSTGETAAQATNAA